MVHMNFLQGLNEDAMPVVMPIMQAHLAEHYALKYFNEMSRNVFELTGQQLPPPTFMDEEGDEEDEIDPEVDAIISQIAAQMPPIQIMPPSEDEGGDEQAEFEAEEARKQQAWVADEKRKADSFAAEQERLDSKVDRDGDRADAVAAVDTERKEETHQQVLSQADEKGKQERRLAKDKAGSKT